MATSTRESKQRQTSYLSTNGRCGTGAKIAEHDIEAHRCLETEGWIVESSTPVADIID